MAKWEARLVMPDASELELGEAGEAEGLYLSGPRRVSAPERRGVFAQSADGDGDDPVSAAYGNRTITYPLRLICADEAAFLAKQAELTAALGKIRGSRAELVETPPGGATELTWDIVGGELGDIDTASPFTPGVQDFELILTAKPLARLPAVVPTVAAGAAGDPVREFDITGVGGDHPALAELFVADSYGQKRRWIAWGLEPASDEPLFLMAEGLTPLGSYVYGTVAGAHGGGSNNTVYQQNLTTDFVELLSTGPLEHLGVFHVFGRFYCPASNDAEVSVRLHWAQGGQFSAYEANPAVRLPDEGAWRIVDLGEVRLRTPIVGSPQWEARVAVRSDEAGDDVHIDWLALLPATYCSGEVAALASDTADSALGPFPLGTIIRHDTVRVERDTDIWSEPGERPGDPLLIPPGDSRLALMTSFGQIRADEPDNSPSYSVAMDLQVIPRTLYLPPT